LKQKNKELERENKNMKTSLSENKRRIEMYTKLKDIQRNSFDTNTFSNFETFLSNLKQLRRADLNILNLKEDYNNNESA